MGLVICKQAYCLSDAGINYSVANFKGIAELIHTPLLNCFFPSMGALSDISAVWLMISSPLVHPGFTLGELGILGGVLLPCFSCLFVYLFSVLGFAVF